MGQSQGSVSRDPGRSSTLSTKKALPQQSSFSEDQVRMWTSTPAPNNQAAHPPCPSGVREGLVKSQDFRHHQAIMRPPSVVSAGRRVSNNK